MDMITVSAKTLDEAITKALLELQTTSEHLHYEIVQKESSGLFGLIGVKPCIIRARVMGEEEERALKKAAADKERAEKAAKAEKERAEREAKRAAEKAAEKKTEAPVKKESVKEAARTDTAARTSDRNEKKDSERKNSERRDFEKKDSEKKDPEKRDSDRRRQDRREGSRRDRQERKETERREEVKEKEKEAKPKQPVKADPEKVQSAAKEFLVQVFGAMGMEVAIETALDLEEGELLVMMSGDDMGILIGKRGQTLDSLQYLVSLVVNKETEGYLRVKLDTENYRERRKETLETLARNISYKVKRTKHPVSLEPMNPYERRIIHSALQNDRYVVTRSEGEDPYRHVVISLKNDRYGNGRRDRYNGRRDRDRDRSFDRQAARQTEQPADQTAAKKAPAENAGSEE